ncbi:hypothetical protein G6F22_020927 [Rhizopus arrhizus]|nr:hypothetical protein G6F22_020927 [Rhizopus arrhizus]
MHLPRDVCDRFVDTGMHAEGQAVAGAVDGVQQGVQLIALVAHHVQHRAEYFARQFADVVDFDDVRPGPRDGLRYASSRCAAGCRCARRYR